ncbi:PAS domain S-box protein [Rhodoplanes sp. TEM]|uniref:histidine kinase n=1 Tax=Rhodoplanes tepidamans TaxID=200616 RepID=A0ABT5JD40_RHOTP|nr:MULTISPECIES: PAS domain S-box protein [Rhodoplanes]MDC7787591.1 PAS domain S-box protein [Rhodoplanes tepidamans]MDC7986884.1 PAS domain S-box protein [Rhodoplanes sp. TEM]MDQ0358019.1 PAS domain S-box-containing protein [Rhodoplanes tepidamans]
MKLTTETSRQPSDDRRFQRLVDAVSDDAIAMLEPDGTVASWNAGAQRIEGFAPSEAIGQPLARFFTPEDRDAGVPDAMIEEARGSGRAEREGWRLRRDGSRFWASSVLRPVLDSPGRLIGFALVTRDLSERQAAREVLEASERSFRLLVDSLTDHAIYMLDPSGVITRWNTGAERLKGFSSDEIVGQHFSRFYTREDRLSGLPVRVLDTAIREGRYEGEGWRVRKDGTRFWASVVVEPIRVEGGRLVGFAKITRDITERRAAQEALRESERQFRLLVKGVTDYALFMLDPNGIVTNWNAGAEAIKGYTAEEIVGQHFSRFYTEQERAAGYPARALQRAAEEGRYEAEGWRVRCDDRQFWAHVVIDAIRDETGTLIGFAKITRDVTERREAQRALQKAEAHRARAQKMEALGQLTGGVAHDFNNLLMIIGGHLRTLQAVADGKLAAGEPKAMRAVEAIGIATRRGEALTRQLLTFSRRQTLNPVVIRIDEHLDGFRSMMESSIGDTTTFAIAAPRAVWPVKVDVSELELALLNLVVNARDAMPNGGIVTIVCENVVLAAGDTPGAIAGDFVAVSVADTGTGIAPDVLPLVFDPFFTTKQAQQGTGLGLSQVHGFAHQSGGTVTIDSTLGAGTTVTLYLPRSHEAPRADSEGPSPAAAEGTALLVEDNPAVADLSAAMLAELGWQVERVGDARAALAASAQRVFALVVSDVVMAGDMDGFALARTLRKQHPGLPVVLVTGYSEAAARAHAEFTVVRKPFRLEDLDRAIARAIAEMRGTPSNLVQFSDARRRHAGEDES